MAAEGEVVGGRYRLVRPLASGHMSRIWLAADEKTDTWVVVKHCAIPQGLTTGQRELIRDLALPEAVAASRVEHPNVIHTLDVLPSWDGPWIVMEYLPSRSLHQMIDESGPLSPVRVARIGLVLVSALRAAGRAGVLHLDVKPGNVLVTTEGRVVLTDFGPAVTPNGIRTLADAGIVLGSPKYIAPERIFDHATDERSDLWSLGATLYHAVEGRPPYTRPTTTEVLRAIGTDPPRPPRLAGPLAPVLAGLLRRDPSERMSMTGAEWALRGVIEASRRRPRSAARRRIPAIVAAVAVTTTLTAVAATAQGETRARTDQVLPTLPAAATSHPAATTTRHPGAVATSGPAATAPIHPAATAPIHPAAIASSDPAATAPIHPAATASGHPAAAATSDPAAVVTSPRLETPPPDGYTWWADPDGYLVAVPAGWRRDEIPGGRAFRSGRDRALLGITPLPEPPSDVVAELEIAEMETHLPGYRRLRLEALPDPSAAVWEYTFQDPDGTVMRSLRRITSAGGRSYVLEWQSTREAWPTRLPDFTVVLASFAAHP
ncbi:protein kinase domain-containing protein [Actinoplanes xinjiangensis]|uniref:protein kinase domain-containing protein n=1 Tax=Actinoplanes xinjiangensis TaxID=512350 RepID=UPI003444E447